jgi:hypothetical protein
MGRQWRRANDQSGYLRQGPPRAIASAMPCPPLLCEYRRERRRQFPVAGKRLTPDNAWPFLGTISTLYGPAIEQDPKTPSSPHLHGAKETQGERSKCRGKTKSPQARGKEGKKWTSSGSIGNSASTGSSGSIGSSASTGSSGGAGGARDTGGSARRKGALSRIHAFGALKSAFHSTVSIRLRMSVSVNAHPHR